MILYGLYNYPMRTRRFNALLLLMMFFGAFSWGAKALAYENLPKPNQTSAYDLIAAMNTLRVSYGLPALIEDPIIDAVAQSTAETMAANNMSWHIGNVRGRLAAAGYGNGKTVWATENFAMSSSEMGIDAIMAIWSDPDHMRPAVNPAYCHVGTGVARANGRTYYVLQAAYVQGQECGSSSGEATSSGNNAGTVSEWIVPVATATPDENGNTYHIVQAGQSFWAIAIAYQVSIADIERWNNLSRDIPLKAGQRLFIPNKNTKGYATPTPYGMVVTQTPDANGKIVHKVQPYQSLIAISEAYHVPIEQILALNGLRTDSILQIGQELVISAGNITPSPTLTRLQQLTPEADGRYYHVVQRGETLSWIANLYEIPLNNLLTWNGLNNTSVIQPGQKILLLVTPPPTQTPSPSLTLTATPSPVLSATSTPLPTASPLITTPEASDNAENSNWNLVAGGGILLLGIWLGWRLLRQRWTVDGGR